MNKPKVYLAGPMAGLQLENAKNWRENAIELLERYGIQGVSPMRHKEQLFNRTNAMESLSQEVLAIQKIITVRDRLDIMNCDGVIANFLDYGPIPSLGTCIEFGWADAFRKPVITVMELGKGNPHDHAMLREISGAILPTLEEAVELMSRWVNP